MDRNFLIAVALSMLIFTVWANQQAEKQAEIDAQRAELEAAQPAEAEPGAIPRAPVPTGQSAESLPQASPVAGVPPRGGKSPVAAVAPPAESDSKIELWERTLQLSDYAVTLSNDGAAIRSWKLDQYPERTGEGEVPIDLIQEGEGPGILRMPLLVTGADQRASRWEVRGSSANTVSFGLRRGAVEAIKTYTFEDEGYGFQLSVDIKNHGTAPVSPTFMLEWPTAAREGNDFREQTLVARHQGEVERELLASVGSGGFFGGGGEAPRYVGDIDWTGVDNRYFAAIMAPAAARRATVTFEPTVPGEAASVFLGFDPSAISPGSSQRHEFRGYIGPKRQRELEKFGLQLESVVNRGYSIIAPLTRFFEWLLAACYSVIPNYGVAIIMLTLLVRLVTWPILQKQMKSMEKMRALQPQITALQEKYADDREKQSQEMMNLYRETGVNPLGGCLPMLLQLPVFIGLFYALQSSIDLRHAAFFGWMNDLSAPEALFEIPGLGMPFRLLPILMAASMVLQQKLQPMQMDAAQAKMMMTLMPIMMLVLFYQFPSGLVLYYMLSNFLGIAHQMWVGKNMST